MVQFCSLEGVSRLESNPTVSIIVNCFNSEQYLREALDSIYAQTYHDWEIIFYDNHSTDNSAKIAKSYDKKLRYVFNAGETLTLGDARNQAIANCTGQYIAFLDCDDLWLPQKLELQIEKISEPHSHPVGICYTDAMRIDTQGNDLLAYSHEKKCLSGYIYHQLITSPMISCSSCLIRTDVLKEVGGFDPSYHYVEEWDVWIKVAKKYSISLVDQCLTKIRIHDANLSRHLNKQYQEKVRLAKAVEKRDPSVSTYCQKAIKLAFLQYQILSFIRLKGFRHKLASIFLLFFQCLRMPIITLNILQKHFSFSVYNTVRKKYSDNN